VATLGRLRQQREIARALGTRQLLDDGSGQPDLRIAGWAVRVVARATTPLWLWSQLGRAARDAAPGERPAVVLSDVVQGRKARRLVLLDFDAWRRLVEAERSGDEAPFRAETGGELR
jgi:hypothetical protein